MSHGSVRQQETTEENGSHLAVTYNNMHAKHREVSSRDARHG